MLSPATTILFNKSLETKTFPTILKIARVTPVHKGDDPTNNYRSISTIVIQNL